MTDQAESSRINIPALTGDPAADWLELRSTEALLKGLTSLEYRLLLQVRSELSNAYAHALDENHEDIDTQGDLAIILASFELYSPNADSIDRMEELLDHPATCSRIATLYLDLDDFVDVSSLRFYTAGTSSWIMSATVRGVGSAHLAIKIAAPPHSLDDEVRTRMRGYSLLSRCLPSHPSLVTVHYSDDEIVIMDFVEGTRLGEWLSQWEDSAPSFHERLVVAEFLSKNTLDLVHRLQQVGQAHKDLSPTNILVDLDEAGKLSSYRVIDFGRNLTLSSASMNRWSMMDRNSYFAPELLDPIEPIQTTCDYYSLGLILLDIVAGGGSSASRGERLRSLYQSAPDLATAIEDMIVVNPDYRLLLDETPGDVGRRCDLVSSRLLTALGMSRNLDQADGELAITARHVLVPSLSGGSLARVRYLRGLRRLCTDGESGRVGVEANRLYAWSATVWGLYLLTVLWFVVLTARDVGLSYGPLSTSSLIDQFELPPDSNEFLVNLPGRLVILSFVIVSSAFYMNLFAGVSVRDLDVPFARWTDHWMRLASVTAFPLAAYVFVVSPERWALAAAIGTAIIAINNLLVARLSAGIVDGQFSDVLPIESLVSYDVDELLEFPRSERFRGWGELMAQYSVALLAVAALIELDLAHDVWVYALAVIWLNIGKLYMSNCFALAPRARGNVHRLTGLSVRASRASAR